MRLGGEVQNWLSKKLICLRKASQPCLLLKCSKVIGNGIIRKLGYGFLFAFHRNYGHIFSCFNTMHECDRDPDRHCMTTRASLGCGHVAVTEGDSVENSLLPENFCRAMICKHDFSCHVVSVCVCVCHVRAFCQNK